jgi:hypothetical protein
MARTPRFLYERPPELTGLRRKLYASRVRSATGLFDRAWPRFRGPVEQHVQAYIDGKITLEQMAANLAAAIS